MQRVKVDGSFDENILQPYDEANKKTKTLQPHKYSQDVHYDLTRAAAQVDVVVKIRFVAPDGTAIPAADNSRRDYINRMTAGIATAWAGKYEFVSTQHPAPPATAPPAGRLGADRRLRPRRPPSPRPRLQAPLPRRPPCRSGSPSCSRRCRSTRRPTTARCRWSTSIRMSEAADSNTPGKRIDSGNWFQNEGNYATGLSAADAEKESVKTAAHEYGHLLGIPDEYSQSNANMHKLMHQASPTLSAGQDNLLDDSARKWMVLRAMYPALARHAKAGATKATAAIAKQKPNLERELRAAVAGIWTDPAAVAAVNTKIVAQLTAGGHPALAAKVTAALQHEGAGLDTGRIAARAVKSTISLASIRTLMDTALRQAITKANKVTIPITNAAGQAKEMNITIGTSTTVNTAAAKGPLAAAAEKVAGATMDAGLGKAGAAPPSLRPGGSFVSELQTLTASWNTPATLGTEASAIKGKAGSEYDVWALDATAVADDAGLNAFARQVVEAISSSLGGEAINTFLSSTFATLMQGQIDAISAVVQTEIDTHRTATPTGTNAAAVATPDPRVAAAVNQLNAKMKALQEAPGTAVPGAKRAGEANAPTTQHTSFSVTSMMGSANEGGMRTDYLNGILDKFNSTLKKADEDAFKTEAKT